MKEKFHYKKEMGQHFIFDPALIEALAEASLVTRADGVLEIGPGRGTLTAALARRARKVLAVELDRTLLHHLDVSLALYPNVEILQGDILRQDLPTLVAQLGTPCRVAANLPYNITTPLLEKLLHAKLPFASIAIMVQKEVGQRMLATPGQPGYGPFSILIAYYTHAEEALEIPASSFTPPPKVDSSFMLLIPHQQPPVPVTNEALFFRTVNAAFAMRRKTLLNNMVQGFARGREDAQARIESAGLDPAVRAEKLTLADFAALAEAFSNTP